MRPGVEGVHGGDELMARTPLTVELLSCPVCGHVGKIPVGLFDGKGFCTGPRSAPHKRMKMTPKKFVEVLAPAEAA